MKNLKINISIISLLLLINFVNADHLIDLRILSSNNSSFIIQLSDIKYPEVEAAEETVAGAERMKKSYVDGY